MVGSSGDGQPHAPPPPPPYDSLKISPVGSPDWKTRILRLEFQAETHDNQLSNLTDKTNAMADSLDSIQRTLAQIRWIAIGAAVALTAKEMGLMSILSAVGVSGG